MLDFDIDKPRAHCFDSYNTGCIKKTEQIRNRCQRREAAQTIKFMIKIDCLGTYDIE